MCPQPIFGIFYMYGLMIAIGLVCCMAVLFLYGKKKNIAPPFLDFIFYDTIFAVFAGFGSAALFQGLYDYIEDPSQGFRLDGGITFIGGLIGGAAVFLGIYMIFRKHYAAKLIDALDIIPCCILIAHAFGRVGCFFAGCCHGKETDSIFGVQFPGLAAPVHPTQLYEAIFLFAMFGVCSFLLFKYDFRHNMSLYLISYGIFRFCNEYLRGDERGELLGFLTPSQFWSVLMVALGVALIFLLKPVREQRAVELAHAAEVRAALAAEEAAEECCDCDDAEDEVETAE